MFANLISSTLFLLVVSCQDQLPSEPPTPPTFQINGTELTDDVIEHVREQIIKDGLDVIHTPDVNVTVGKKHIVLQNGTIIGLANFYRVGDVIVTVSLTDTKVRSAFAFYNVSADQDISIRTKCRRPFPIHPFLPTIFPPPFPKRTCYNYEHGHIHMNVDNVTVYTVFKFDHVTQDLTLDEFELSVGDGNFSITGLGEKAQNDSATITTIVNETKGPVLKVFNITFKLLINVALRAVKNALLAAG